jgi:PEGA domain
MKSILAMGRKHVAGAIAIAIALTPLAAAAQSAPPQSAGPSGDARAHFAHGVTFYDEADYSAALVEFQRAYTVAPAWQVLFNIGQSYFQIRNYAEALVTLKRFVDEGQDRIPEARRVVVEAELADLANRVGHAKITSNLSGARITIDNSEVGVTPLREPVLASVGVRRVKAAIPRGAPVEQEVSVPAGETVDVHLDFPEPAPAPAPPVAHAPPVVVRTVQVAPDPPRNAGPAFVAFGIAIAGAAVGSVFGDLTLRDRSRLEGECSGKACGPGSQSDIDAVSRDGTVSTIAFGVAAVGVVVGVTLWLTVRGPARSRDRELASAPPVRLGPGFVAGSF